MADSTIERINNMESRVDKAAGAVEKAEQALSGLEAALPDFSAFAEYYGSEDWFSDLDAYNNGELPKDVKCGVLSEDLPYDLITDAKDLAMRMMRAALAIIEAI